MLNFTRHLLCGILLSLFSLSLSSKLVAQQDVMSVVHTMIQKVDEVNTLMYSQEKWERIEGKLSYGSGIFKVQVRPFKVYMKQYAPREGTEVLYKAGWNDGDAKVNAGKLIPNLSLDPNGSRMRKGNHHPITNAGFLAVTKVARALLDKFGEQAPDYIKLLDDATWDGRPCYKFEMSLPDWGWRGYNVKAGEDLLDIAKRYAVSEYMIMEGNTNIDDYDDIEPGQRISIPTDYAKRTVIYVDKAHYMPVKTLVYDNKGLYERYEFKNVMVNPPLNAMDFDMDNAGYGF